MTRDDDGRRIKSVDRTVEIMEGIHALGGATVSELAERTGLSPGTVHTHLSTLDDRGFVRKVDGRYDLGYQLMVFGEYVRNHSTLYRHGREVVDGLADETGDAVHLIVEDDGLEVILYESFGQDAVGTEFYIQNREFATRHLHYSAAGKAILAHLSRERVEEIVERHGLPGRTDRTVGDVDVLFEELERVRDRGFAVNDEEAVRGLHAVGAPVLDRYKEPIGAISLSAPTSRHRNDAFADEAVERVMEAANIIEVNVQTSDIEQDRFESE
ncbi:IclR family transcriptional regulator [Salinigranum salinum]|uniref:IclR family transcriptional regulator n=1 Tax=Salinigranum salinum TaxID=1364937 RepID=UPI001261073C|nr:IclR family transcriptional regulator [Salinigranum salinum]